MSLGVKGLKPGRQLELIATGPYSVKIIEDLLMNV
jgi:hypothetical protein